jgi:preprotein translocase subunit SecG
MLELYRGIIDILTARCEALNDAFAKHIREFNNGETDDNNFGVKGFWNLLLEITFVMYVKIFVGIGIVLTVLLAIIFFPLYAMTVAVTNILNHKATPFVEETNYIEPTQEKK